MKKIYLDYAAATPTDKRVLKSMKRYFFDDFANAGAIHDAGKEAKRVVANAREDIRRILDAANSKEIVFTSGGSESNGLAIIGYIEAYLENNPEGKLNLFTSRLEHPSVLQVFRDYEKKGFETHFVNVKENGQIDTNNFREKLEKAEGDSFVSFMYVNNETGIFQPIKEVSKIIKKSSKKDTTVFHTDACQAPLYLTLNVNSLGVDLMSLCSQKIYGPKGSGCVYIKEGTPIKPMFVGGKQENGMRTGTENTSLIVGFAKAMKLADENKDKYIKEMNYLKDMFLDSVLEEGKVELNGEREFVLPLAMNLSFLNTEKTSEQIVLYFNSKGIYVSSKSACMGSNTKNSEVVESMRGDRKNSIRFCVGSLTTKEDLKKAIKVLGKMK